MNENDARHLAALATISIYYNDGKDIVDILSEFVLSSIISHKLSSFNTLELKHILEDDYGFNKVPTPVIRTVLRRHRNRIKSDGDQYSIVDRSLFSEKPEVNEIRSAYSDKNQLVLESLYEYTEKILKRTLTSEEKRQIDAELCSLVTWELETHKSNSEYGTIINGFLIERAADSEFSEVLGSIREGAIIYSGLQNIENINEIERWQTKLQIFLDTEILFYLSGLDGTVYKEVVGELLDLVDIANKESIKKNSRPVIELRYFLENKAEIDRIFSNAEMVVRGHTQNLIAPTDNAVTLIANGCSQASDVVMKKTQF